jgi:[acyl-carrier-protein] S-malonyltransferase
MFDGPADELTLTQHAQPALLAHGAAAWAVLRDAAAGQVVAAAGHSLGEFTAYHAAGALSAEAAARLVRRRGELMYHSGVSRPGAMAARARRPHRADRGDLRARERGSGAPWCPANFNAPGAGRGLGRARPRWRARSSWPRRAGRSGRSRCR